MHLKRLMTHLESMMHITGEALPNSELNMAAKNRGDA